MASRNTFEELNKIFRDVFDNDTIAIFETMTAKDLQEWDSLNHINLIVAAERHFKIKFTTQEIMTFQNVGHFANAIEQKLGVSAGKA